MTDSVTVFPPGWRLTDANDDPISGGTIEFYTAGSSTPKTVYSDSALATSVGTSVTTDAGGYPTSGGNKCIIYTTTTALKIILKDAAGSAIATHDNFRPVNITTTSGTGATDVEVHPKTADFTAVAGDKGYLFQCDPTGGTFQVTLTSAVTLGNGWSALFRHDGTANQVKIATSSGQYIKLPGGSTTAGFALTGKGHLVRIVCDGAGFVVDNVTEPFLGSNLSTFTVEDRVSAFPTSPVVGGRYLFNATPTGAAATAGFAQHDIAEYDGQGSYTKYTPYSDCGWIAYIKDENLNTQYQGTAWTDLSNVTAPATTYLQAALFQDQKTSGTNGGSNAAGAWTTRTLNTTVSNSITGCTIASNVVTLPTGQYYIVGRQVFGGVDKVKTRFRSTTGSTVLLGENILPINTASPLYFNAIVSGIITVSGASETFDLQYYATTVVGAAGLGSAQSIASVNEVYASLEITSLASQQGAQGVAGTTGSTGPGYAATSTTSIAMAASGSKSITTQTGLAYTAGARIRLTSAGTPADYWEGVITSYTSGSGALVFTADKATNTATHADWNINLAGEIGSNGSNGAAGATGASGPVAIDYTWDTGTTAADPGSGKIRANNATLSSATALYINETDRLGNSLANFIATWDDSTSTNKGVLEVIDLTTPTNRVFFTLTALTDNGSYDTLTVTYRAGATSFSAVNVALLYFPAGDKGADGAGSFTSLTPGNGITSTLTAAAPGSAITTSGTVSAAEPVNAQTGTTYTVVDGDRAKLLTLSNASSVAVTLPQAATSTAFVTGWFVDVMNLGAGTVTITPTTSTIAGSAALTIRTGRGCRIISDGTNYQVDQLPLAVVVASGKLLTVSNTLTLAGTDSTTMTFPAVSSTVVTIGNTATLGVGFACTPYSAGTKSSGTYTPAESDGAMQYAVNGGAHTLAPPANNTTICVQYTNNGSAGAITTSGFTKVSGSFTTTNGDDFMCFLTRNNGFTLLSITALQ